MNQENEIRQALAHLANMFAQHKISQEVFFRKQQELLSQLSSTSEQESLFSQSQPPQPGKELRFSGMPPKQNVPLHLFVPSDSGFPKETQDHLNSTISPAELLDESAWTPLPNLEPGLVNAPELLSSRPIAKPHRVQTNPTGHSETWVPLLRKGDRIRNRYEIKEPLGHGGTGYVFCVQDIKFGGDYTLKVLHPQLNHQPDVFRSWLQTFTLQQTLQHPGIARTYLLDEDPEHDIVFYLREYIEGESLQSLLDRQKSSGAGTLPIPKIMHLFQALVQIIRFAHEHQMHFLNLTPQNLMLPTEKKESAIQLLDFVLFYPVRGSFQGWSFSRLQKDLFYIPPEQLTGMGLHTATPATTVFVLGILLYHMLTGELPVAMAAPPSVLLPHLPSQIDDVLQKATHARPELRYQDIDDLVKDVYTAFAATANPTSSASSAQESTISGSPPPPQTTTPSKAPSFSQPISRQIHPNFPSSPGSFLRGIPPAPPRPSNAPRLPGGGSSRLNSSPPQAPARPVPPESRAVSASSQEPLSSRPKTQAPQTKPPTLVPKRPLSQHPTNSPQGKDSSGEPIRPAHLQFRTGQNPLPLAGTNSAAVSNADRIARLRTGGMPAVEPPPPENVVPAGHNVPPIQTLYKHQKGVLALATHPSRNFLVSTSLDGTLQLWDSQTWHPIYHQEIPDGPGSHVCWNARGDRLAYSNNAGRIFLQDLHRNQPLWTHQESSPCSGLQWHPQYNILFITFSNGVCERWDLEQKPKQQWRMVQEDGVEHMALHAFCQQIVTVSLRGRLRAWPWDHTQTPQDHVLPAMSEESCYVLGCFSKSAQVLVGTRQGQIIQWDLQKQHAIRNWKAHLQSVRAFVVPQHEHWWASAGNDQRIHLWSATTGNPLCTFATQPGTLRTLATEPQGLWLASAGSENTIQIWDTSMWNSPM